MKKLLLVIAIFFSSIAQAEIIKIGVVSILSGEVANFGKSFVQTIELAAAEYNKNSKVKVQLVIEDDAFTPSKGLSAIKKLLEVDRVSAIINLSTPTINSSYNLLSQKNIPVVQWGLFEKADEVDNIFMMQGKLDPAITTLAKFIEKRAGQEAVELFYFEDPSVVFYIDLFKKEFSGDLSVTAVPSDLSGVQSLVTKSINNTVKHVVVALMPDAGSEIIKRFTQLGHKPQYYSLWTLEPSVETYQNKLGKNAESFRSAYFTTTTEPTDVNFLANFKQQYNKKPEPLTETGYDCFNVLMKNYDSDPNVWRQKIAAFEHQGVSGPIKFDSAGNRISQVKLLQVKEILTATK